MLLRNNTFYHGVLRCNCRLCSGHRQFIRTCSATGTGHLDIRTRIKVELKHTSMKAPVWITSKSSRKLTQCRYPLIWTCNVFIVLKLKASHAIVSYIQPTTLKSSIASNQTPQTHSHPHSLHPPSPLQPPSSSPPPLLPSSYSQSCDHTHSYY